MEPALHREAVPGRATLLYTAGQATARALVCRDVQTYSALSRKSQALLQISVSST